MTDGVRGPLDGLLVADFSRVLAGPYATMLLADLGADVIKVEGPAGDDTRTWTPPVRDGVATYYLGVNRGKRSVVLDFREPRDARLARELARRADVVIENFKPGGLARYGLDHTSVSAVNPGVVYASISGFGTGPGRDVPGYDLMVQAISGLMSLTGDPEGPAYRAGISVFDVMAGNHAAIGILAALRHRDSTGRGQLVEVNLLSSALTGLVNHSSAYAAGGTVPYRMGNAHPSVFPYEPLPTADRDLIVTAANDGQFRRLCEVLGIPETADDPRFRHNADRTGRREELRPILVERLRTRGALEWFDLLVAAGVPCGPINTIDGGFAMAERFGLDPVVEAGEGERAVPTTRNPIRFSETPAAYRLPPPVLDEHGEDVRAWLEGGPDPRERTANGEGARARKENGEGPRVRSESGEDPRERPTNGEGPRARTENGDA
ncbi:CoA transferase [Streptomyces sp. NPDC001185]|uniref:CaiB/BaiF CoA transferase family protein n=1 Tax=Streptomyces sp. NPDC001185 TaxID=3154380 RepID=UPI0033182F5A